MEEHYIKDVGKITYVYGVNLEEHKTVIEKQQKRIAELEQELAELKEKAIVPKFKHQDYVYAICSYKDIFRGQIDVFDYYSNTYFIFFGEDIGSDWFSENLLFATEQEAQAKLKEMKGNE